MANRSHLRPMTVCLALLGLLLLAHRAPAGEPRLSWPVDRRALRVEWDGRGELLLQTCDGDVLARAMRSGPGLSWLYPKDMTRGSRSMPELDLVQSAPGVRWAAEASVEDGLADYLWCGRPPGPATRSAFEALCGGRESPPRSVTLERADQIPPLGLALTELRAVVLSGPLAGASDRLTAALVAYAAHGGCLVICAPATTLPAADPAWAALREVTRPAAMERLAPVPGQPDLWRRPLGRGWLIVAAERAPVSMGYWQRVAFAANCTRRADGTRYDSALPDPLDLARALDPRRPAPAPAWLALLAAYLAAMVWLSRRALRWSRLLVAPVLAALCVAGAMVLIEWCDRHPDTACQVDHIQSTSGSSVAWRETGLRVATRRGGDFWLAAPAMLSERSEDWGARTTNEAMALGPMRLKARSAGSHRLCQVEMSLGAATLDLIDSGKGLRGVLRTQLAQPLEGAVLVWGKRRCLSLGDLPARGERRLDGSEAWQTWARSPSSPQALNLICGPQAPPAARALPEATARLAARPRKPSQPEQPVNECIPPDMIELIGWLDLGPSTTGVMPEPPLRRRLSLLHVVGWTAAPGGRRTIGLGPDTTRTLLLAGTPDPWKVMLWQPDGALAAGRAALRFDERPAGLRLWNIDRQRWDRLPASGRVASAAPYLRDSTLITSHRPWHEPRRGPGGEAPWSPELVLEAAHAAR